ncbi:MAG: tetratricopeptide repeat protein [Anaerolineae bacterium]
MADLSITQEAPGRLVLCKRLAQRLGSLVIGLGLAGVLLYMVGSLFSDSGSGENIIVFLLFLGFTTWRSLSSALVSTSAVIDSAERRVTLTTDFLGAPLRRVDVAFDRIVRVLVTSRTPVIANRTGSRAVWRVALETRDTPLLYINSNGAYPEMVDLGGKVAGRIGLPLSDELKQLSSPDSQPTTPSPIQDFSGGGSPSYAPPVASPMPLGRRVPAPARSSTANQPPANTLIINSGTPDAGYPASDVPEPASYIPAPVMNVGDAGATYLPSLPALGAMGDAGAMSMPAMAPLDLSGSFSQAATLSMPPLGSGFDTGPSFSMPPLGGTASGQGMGTASYSQPALGMPDQAPLGTITSVSSAVPAAASVAAPEPAAPPAQSWVRPRTYDELQKAIADDPNDAQAYYQLARSWHARGGYNEALAAYQQAVHLDPTSAPAQNDLGVLYLQRGKYGEAEVAFRRASGLDPFFVVGHYNLGMLLARTRRSGEARQAFMRGLQSAATDAEQRLFENAQKGIFVNPILSP